MIVKFTTNIGSIDAAGLSLDHTQCCEGMECHVSEAAGQRLVARCHAIDVTPEQPNAKAKPKQTQEPKPVAAPAETLKPTK